MSLKSLLKFDNRQSVSSAALEMIVKSIPSGVIVVEKASEKIVYINNRFVEITGFNPNGLSLREYALNMAKVRKLDNTPFLYEQLPLTKALFCGRTTRNREIVIHRADHSKLIVLVNAKPLIDDKGEITGAIAIFEDVTERKKIEEALTQSNLKTSEILESIQDGFFALDKNWCFIYVNKKAANNLDMEPKDLINNNLWQKFPKVLGTIHEVNYRKAMLERTAQHFQIKGVLTDRWYDISVYPTEEGISVYWHDITEGKKAEEALKKTQILVQEYANTLEQLVEARTKRIKESEQSYRELYESFGEAFIATDWELNVTHWNKVAERVASVPAKVALGKKIYEVMPEMVSVDIMPYLETLRQKKPARFMMNTVSRETKKPSMFEISAYPSAQGIIIIVEDKTEEEETKRLSAIGQIAGMVGHDIRNPLQAILCDVYLLKEYLASMPKMQTKDDVAESLDGIEQNVDYVNKIVADLQDYVKPLAPSLKETNIETTLDDVLVKKALPENIEVYRTIQARAGRLISDPDLLKRILANLINNAVQAMPKGGKLSIRAIREGNDLIITIEDNGVGIPEDVKPKLFTPLFTTKSKGQGFGLAACKRMTEALGGTISFESEVGKGTKFTLRLPPLKK